MKKVFALLILAGFLYSCASSEASNATADSASATTSATSAKTGSSGSKWNYRDDVDKMTSEKRFFATIDANEKLQFDFPYNGGSTAQLMIVYQDKSNDIFLSISKGQFIVGIDGGEIKARFDDKKAMTFPCTEPSDNSSDVIYIGNEKKFVKELKKAKKVLIEAEFYEAGVQQMEFNTADFKWNH